MVEFKKSVAHFWRITAQFLYKNVGFLSRQQSTHDVIITADVATCWKNYIASSPFGYLAVKQND